MRSHPLHRSTVALIKVTYIVCAVTLTTSFIVGSFLVHMLVLPYFHESEFEPGICSIQKIDLHLSDRLKCENKCSKERSSFPCIRVTIFFKKNNENRTGHLFDNIVTHQNYRSNGVWILYKIISKVSSKTVLVIKNIYFLKNEIF